MLLKQVLSGVQVNFHNTHIHNSNWPSFQTTPSQDIGGTKKPVSGISCLFWNSWPCGGNRRVGEIWVLGRGLWSKSRSREGAFPTVSDVAALSHVLAWDTLANTMFLPSPTCEQGQERTIQENSNSSLMTGKDLYILPLSLCRRLRLCRSVFLGTIFLEWMS